MKIRLCVSVLVSFFIFTLTAYSQDKPATCPLHEEHQAQKKEAAKSGASHEAHHAEVNERGDRAMGFSHKKTTHHFILTSEGGLIEVTANDAEDETSINQIRQHLAEIARSFSEGDFEKPMLTHDRIPPGVPAMVRLKAQINFNYEEMERGARVRITSSNAEALDAVHQFLRFQIEDHQTGDPLKVRE